jgi:polyisoprenoid-binding protein YceI
MQSILRLVVLLLIASVNRAQAPKDIPVFKATPVKSTIKFGVKASVPIAGTFEKWDAKLTYRSNYVEDAAFDVKIQASSVNTGSGMKDGKLKSKDFFNAQEDPYITFHAEKIIQTGPNTFQIPGTFTIRGVSKPETLDLTLSGTTGSGHGEVTGTMAFDRKDYHMNSAIPFIKIAARVEVTVDPRSQKQKLIAQNLPMTESGFSARFQPNNTLIRLPEAFRALPAFRAVPAVAEPVIRYIAGSTIKVEQLLGEEDKQLHQPTLSQTGTRYGIEGTDLGNSFENGGRVYFLFGDTVGRLRRALDTIATTDAHDPESGVRLDFLKSGSDYLTIQPPGISMGAFEVPVAGISLGGQMYVVVSTNHSEDGSTDRSVLTKFTSPASFQPLRTISQLPGGHFVKMSLRIEPGTIAGMPPGGPFILVWGTGAYRKSDAYLSIVPAAQFESGKGTRYFAGLDARNSPIWSDKESDSNTIVQNGTLGDLSVTWCKDLGLWLMTYDSREPAPRGILFSYSRTPWGPWSEPQVIFNALRDGAVGKFIHNPQANPDDGLAGPVIGRGQANPRAVHGGAYAPYVIERWTKVRGPELSIYYVLSTWNPYVVVLMKSRLHVE